MRISSSLRRLFTMSRTSEMAAIARNHASSLPRPCGGRPTSPSGSKSSFLLAFFSRTNDNYKQAMISRRCVLSITVVLTALLAGRPQTPPPHGLAKDDYSQEAAVIEQMATKIAFDNDGKFNREQTSRVRVQTDSGVKQWGLLSFPFQSATQTVEIDYVRVRKIDGTTLITPPDNVQDLDSEITRSAPFYRDLRETHVAVKGMGKGDTVGYQAH